MRYTVQLPNTWLEYWISRFPSSFDDMDGPTHLEAAQARFKNSPSRQKRDQATKAWAYDSVFSTFRMTCQSLQEQFRSVRRALGV
jgi:hypothetical protein